jgi:predicted GIY-YIG superfamily endonuclease
MAAWLYIMTNRRDGTFYIGVTTAIAARAWQHKTGAVPGFTKKYGLTRLVYVETHDSINEAIRRERTSVVGRNELSRANSWMVVPSTTMTIEGAAEKWTPAQGRGDK